MKICWLSDIHLNFVSEEAAKALFESVRVHDSQCVFVTGDISESPALSFHLDLMDQIVGKPVYFILGNHDFWYSTTQMIWENLPKLVNKMSFMKYMTAGTYMPLDTETCVIGHDGWYDARYGDAAGSKFGMRDWSIMGDYVNCKNIHQVIEKSQEIAAHSVEHFRKNLVETVKRYKKIVLLTHMPPFDDTHIYQGQIGEAHAQPWFTNRMLGELFYTAAKANPGIQFVVFAGHTHGRISKDILPNLLVHVAGVDYGAPVIQSITSI